ncbi:unnamed protein product [Trichogramma brassicae]|uniref:Uncharacterized protein n=1 Tax=Trichogramma brassicae TaxID=86971 RepID=A0A6H5HX25_9HYME|nr:unnamed protein product [Trichogramma brassicae]
MSKRLPRGGHNNVYSPAKRQRLDVTRESSNLSQQQQSSSNARYATANSCKPSTSSNSSSSSSNNNNGLVPIQSANAFEDLWGDDDFDPGDDELEELDFIASQATQEERVFKPPQPPAPAPSKVSPGAAATSRNNGTTVVVKASQQFTIVQSQMLASSSSSCISKEIEECSQAFEFDDFEKDVKSNYHNSTFCPKPANSTSNIVLVSDGEEVAKLKEENKKLLDDFMTKEGETEFLRQHLNQMQQRYEAAKKEQERIIKEERMKFEADRNELMKRNTALESELQLKKISEAMQNDDIRDMNELYMSEFYELPVSHTHNFCEAKAWYDLERGVETRRAVGLLSHLVSASDYLADYICGNRKLEVKGDKEFESYAKQMNSYNSWWSSGT